jgi:hypothetical protein
MAFTAAWCITALNAFAWWCELTANTIRDRRELAESLAALRELGSRPWEDVKREILN